MGCSCSIDEEVNLEVSNTKWKAIVPKIHARNKYIKDGTLPRGASDDLLELRMFLNDPVLLRNLGNFAKTNKDSVDLLICWMEILVFKCIDDTAVDLQHEKGSSLYYRYISKDADCPIVGVSMPDEWHESVTNALTAAEHASASSSSAPNEFLEISSRLFDKYHQACLELIYERIFLPFKQSETYGVSVRDMKRTYNQIDVDDFDYFEVLGSGSYGCVVHCRKRSTDKHYAMKIQTKAGLLDCFSDCPGRVVFEKQAAEVCRHTFIAEMDYAFQTSTLALMVMELGTAGTLNDALQLCDRKSMSLERVRFYSAEIVSALAHIHRLGLIYRDLKPQNVLLCADGHIKLVDMGGVIDVGGGVLGDVGDARGGIFASRDLEGDRYKRVGKATLDSEESVSRRVAQDFQLGNFAMGFVRATSGLLLGGRGADGLHNSGLRRNNKVNVVNQIDQSIDKNKERDSERRDVNFVSFPAQEEGPALNGFVQDKEPRKASLSTSGARRNTNGDIVPPREGFSLYALPANTAPIGLGALPPPEISKLDKATSIMGTGGYMAPEMLMMKDSDSCEGYTAAVDFWSLGVTMYKLLTGEMPFHDAHVSHFVEHREKAIAALNGESCADKASLNHPAYAKCIIKLKRVLGEDEGSGGMEAVMAFLETDENKRLGSGPNGLSAIKHHHFYKDIVWQNLIHKKVTPPYMPSGSTDPTSRCAPFDSFEEMLQFVSREQWLNEEIPAAEQKFFENWNHVSPSVLRAEMYQKANIGNRSSKIRLSLLGIQVSGRSSMHSSGSYNLSFNALSARRLSMTSIAPDEEYNFPDGSEMDYVDPDPLVSDLLSKLDIATSSPDN